eukprot:6091379-Prymnesium_polylepis.1
MTFRPLPHHLCEVHTTLTAKTMAGSSTHSEMGDDGEALRTSSCWDLSAEWDLSTGEGAKGDHSICPDGTIGAEYQMIKQAEVEGTKAPAVRDPYHGQMEEPRILREPKRETFN